MQAEAAQNIHASNNQLVFSFERERERDVMFHTPPMGPQDELHKNQDWYCMLIRKWYLSYHSSFIILKTYLRYQNL